MKKADASGARYAVIIGDDEVSAQRVTLKPLRGGGEQKTLDARRGPRGSELKMAGSYDFEEQERIAELKAWWEDNRWYVAGAIVAAILVFAGWRGWQWWTVRQAEEAAALFKPVAEAPKGDEAKLTQAAKPLVDRYPGSYFASEAQLAVARAAFDAGHLDEARTRLQWVLDRGAAEHRGVARLRLAAVAARPEEIRRGPEAPRRQHGRGLRAAHRRPARRRHARAGPAGRGARARTSWRSTRRARPIPCAASRAPSSTPSGASREDVRAPGAPRPGAARRGVLVVQPAGVDRLHERAGQPAHAAHADRSQGHAASGVDGERRQVQGLQPAPGHRPGQGVRGRRRRHHHRARRGHRQAARALRDEEADLGRPRGGRRAHLRGHAEGPGAGASTRRASRCGARRWRAR